VQIVGRILLKHFPAPGAHAGGDRNELPDKPALL